MKVLSLVVAVVVMSACGTTKGWRNGPVEDRCVGSGNCPAAASDDSYGTGRQCDHLKC